MNPIIIGSQIIATNADILNGTRIATAPYNGIMTFKIQASDNNATDNFVVGISLPGGDVPLDTVRVPCGNSTGLAGVLDDRTALIVSFRVQQGGQVLFSAVETGDAELSFLVRFAPQ